MCCVGSSIVFIISDVLFVIVSILIFAVSFVRFIVIGLGICSVGGASIFFTMYYGILTSF